MAKEEVAMPYKFQPGKMFRMPTHFGPSLGPRQGEGGRKFTNVDSPKRTIFSVSFLSNRKQLEELLPEGFALEEEPVVTVEVTYITELEWLAGRGYNTLGVSFPAVFYGKKDRAVGRFLAVLWENLADPIITGREELGFSKIYCEIPEPVVYQGKVHCIGGWLGFKFMDLRIRNLKQLSSEEVRAVQSKKSTDGTLHYKYMPRTGEWGKPDISYVTLTPFANPNVVVKEMWRGEGTVQFHKATWEDLPTMFTIVNILHDLEIQEYRGAMMVKSAGGKDISDQRILQ
jgi:acetoacetate decarboxylase